MDAIFASKPFSILATSSGYNRAVAFDLTTGTLLTAGDKGFGVPPANF
jgi:hypothetical protein